MPLSPEVRSLGHIRLFQNPPAMKNKHLLLLACLWPLLFHCHREAPTEKPAPFGVETYYDLTGNVDGKPFVFYLREARAWSMVGHSGYFHAWEVDYEFNSTTTADGRFYFRLEYPMKLSPYEALQPGPLTKNLDYYCWTLHLALPDGDGLATYEAAHRHSAEDEVVRRSQYPAAPARVRERSPVLFDHMGLPYFEVRIRFELPVVQSDTPEQKGRWLNAEGLFRVPVKWEQLEQ